MLATEASSSFRIQTLSSLSGGWTGAVGLGVSALTGGLFSCRICLTVPVDEGFELGGVWVHVDLALILSYASSYFLSTVDSMPRPTTDLEDAGVGGGVCG